MREYLMNSRKGQFISGTILVTLLGAGATLFFAYQLIGALAVVGNYLALAGAFVLSGSIVYYGFEEDYLDDFFSSDGIEVVFLVLIGAAVGPIAYRLFDALLATTGNLVGGLLIGLATLSVFFGTSYVLGGIATLAGLLADLMGIVGGEN